MPSPKRKNGLLRRFAPRNDGALIADMRPYSRGTICPSFAKTFSLEEGAGNAGCTLHPRSRVQNCAKKRTRAYRFSGGTPAFPAQWSYGLCRDLLGDEFLFVTVAGELAILPNPVELVKPPPT